MESPNTLKSTISGYLPIRSALQTQQDAREKNESNESDETEAPDKNAQVEDAVNEPSNPKPKPAETILKLDEAVAAVIGPQLVAQMQKKKKKNRGPKGKRGVVSVNASRVLATKINPNYENRASQLDLRNGVLMGH